MTLQLSLPVFRDTNDVEDGVIGFVTGQCKMQTKVVNVTVKKAEAL